VVGLRYRELQNAIDHRDDEQLLRIFLEVVAQTYDPHSEYLGPSELNEFNIDTRLTISDVTIPSLTDRSEFGESDRGHALADDDEVPPTVIDAAEDDKPLHKPQIVYRQMKVTLERRRKMTERHPQRSAFSVRRRWAQSVW
jgi:hypothetical protein